jgi:acyl carrier protein
MAAAPVSRRASGKRTMASYETCLARVLELLSASAKERGPVSESSDLVGELGLSSIDVMEMIEGIEDEFDISFPLNSLSSIRTAGELAAEIARLAP